MTDRAELVEQACEEISRYLEAHENAADTFDGLVSWWVFRQRLVESEAVVREAVGQLIEAGKIEVRELGNGKNLLLAKRAGTTDGHR